jgi:hypothetical protein
MNDTNFRFAKQEMEMSATQKRADRSINRHKYVNVEGEEER